MDTETFSRLEKMWRDTSATLNNNAVMQAFKALSRYVIPDQIRNIRKQRRRSEISPPLVKPALYVRSGYPTGQKTKPTAPIWLTIADAICGVSRNHMH
jgi:hypothetical protein